MARAHPLPKRKVLKHKGKNLLLFFSICPWGNLALLVQRTFPLLLLLPGTTTVKFGEVDHFSTCQTNSLIGKETQGFCFLNWFRQV